MENKADAKSNDTLLNEIVKKPIHITDLFSEKCFPFIRLESIDEYMLRKETDKGEFMYRDIFKPLTSEQYRFFNFNGVEGTFFEKEYFLIAMQEEINGSKVIIVHTSTDFNYYCSYLYVLSQGNKKLDSVKVSHFEYSTGGDEPYAFIGESKSVFKQDLITTTDIEFKKFDNDSIVTIDSIVVVRKINHEGHIVVVSE